MATLESSYEDDLREAVLDDFEEKFASSDGPIQRTARKMDALLESYGRRNDYDYKPLIQSRTTPTIQRGRNRITAEWRYEHPAAAYWELGTDDHIVRGDPVVSFIWSRSDDPPQWVRDEFDREGDGWRVSLAKTDVSGLPPARFVRDGLRWFRREVLR